MVCLVINVSFLFVGCVCRYFSDSVSPDCVFVFFKQKTAYGVRISDWSSDVCSSDLVRYREIAQDIVADAQKLLGTFDDLDLASRIERGDFEAAAGVVN